MEKKHCTSCRQTTWHNLRGNKNEPSRCTYCGHPVSNNPGKREHQEGTRRKLAQRVGAL